MDTAKPTKRNERLRQERLQRNWRQSDLAEQIGTTALTVRRWERGSQQTSAYFRAKLCMLFGKSAEELGLVEGNPTSPPSDEGETAPVEQTPLSSTNEFTLWTVPYQRNPHFTGRDAIFEQLDRHLSPETWGDQTTTCRAALTQPQALKGLGGIGKTQVAVEYAYRAQEQGRYTHIIWVNVSSEDTLMASFMALAELLPALSMKNETDQRKLVLAIKRWLAQCQERWLLIFDNADEVALVQEYLPQHGNGSILLTTRANAVASIASPVEVEQMGLTEGIRFLLHRAQRLCSSDEESNEAMNVVIALDGFPLALDQAGAYIEETGCSIGTYLQLYQDHRHALLARRGIQATNYPDSVATTWSLSFQKVEQINPAAAECLHLCAFLAPDHIPEELFRDGAAYWPPLLQQAAGDLFTFNQILEALLTFSLVKRLTNDHMLSIHRLVQAVQMDMMEPAMQRQWAERVVRAVNAVFPREPKEDVTTWTQCLRYLGQAQMCDMLIQHYQFTLPEAADVLDRTGTYLREHASYTLAEQLYQRAVQIWERQPEREHPQMAYPLNNLAHLYLKQGKYVEAELLFRQALHMWEQQFGSEHPQVAHPLNGLAIIYETQGKYTEAEQLFLRVISIREQLGPEHPQMAYPLNGLAIVYRDQGRYAEAGPLYQRALSIWEQQFGSDHPNLITPLNNLGTLYREQGKYAEAEPLFLRSHSICEQQLGPEHPQTAYSLTGLAELRHEQKRYTEAEPLYRKALSIWEQQLGSEHPQVAYPLSNLAELCKDQGRYAEAEPLYRKALSIWEQQLGSEHPLVVYALNELATLYKDLGRYTEAEPLYQRALSIREHVLAPYHPDIAEILHDFAAFQQVQGKLQEAISFYQRALATREHVFGPDDPKTIETRERLRAVQALLERTEEVAMLDKKQAAENR